MKILIAYAGYTGTTEKAARILEKLLPSAERADLTKRTPDPSKYGFVIIGSAIHAGMVHKAVRKYLVDNWDVLRDKKKAVYICNAFIHQSDKILKSNYSVELRNGCVAVDSFGGELNPDGAKGISRLFLQIMKKRLTRHPKTILPVLQTDRIKAFAGAVREASAEEGQRK